MASELVSVLSGDDGAYIVDDESSAFHEDEYLSGDETIDSRRSFRSDGTSVRSKKSLRKRFLGAFLNKNKNTDLISPPRLHEQEGKTADAVENTAYPIEVDDDAEEKKDDDLIPLSDSKTEREYQTIEET